MKKTLSVLLVLLLLLSLAPSFAAEEPGGIFAELTGIPDDQTVMRVGEKEISSEFYFYWFCYVSSYIEYNLLSDYKNYGLYSSMINKDSMTIDWNSEINGMPIIEYVRAQTAETIKYYMAVEELAEENGVVLNAEDNAAMEAEYQESVASMGGEEGFEQFLAMLGIGRENFDRISAATYLYAHLLSMVVTEGSPLYLDDEGYNKYATFADHILLASEDLSTGEALSAEAFMEKYLLAEDLLEQLGQAEDKAAKFKELADEYSEDPGRASYPEGYVYTPGTMVAEFESAAAQLQPGEISGIVQSDYGIHIIMRKELLPELEKHPEQKEEITKTYFTSVLSAKKSGSAVSYEAVLDSVNFNTFYEDYIVKAQSVAG